MNSYFLKIFALIFMTIDHIGAVSNIFEYRVVGRVSFPIFAFLLAESLTYTRNKGKFIIRLFIFAIITEVFFNLFINSTIEYIDIRDINSYFNSDYQNVMFTFFFSAVLIYIYELGLNKLRNIIFLILTIAIGIMFNSDYGAIGIALPFAFYIVKGDKLKSFIIVLFFSYYLYNSNIFLFLGAMVSFFFIVGYKREFITFKNKYIKNINKWFFYIYYPLHMLVLAMLGI